MTPKEINIEWLADHKSTTEQFEIIALITHEADTSIQIRVETYTDLVAGRDKVLMTLDVFQEDDEGYEDTMPFAWDSIEILPNKGDFVNAVVSKAIELFDLYFDQKKTKEENK